VAWVLDLNAVGELVGARLDERTIVQPELVYARQHTVAPVRAQAGDELDALLDPPLLDQGL
jgi:hypothetical protein